MKTIKNIDSYQRVPDKVAEQKVKNGDWQYCTKTEWKEKVRDLNKKKENKEKVD